MSYGWTKLILESIRAWLDPAQSLQVMLQIEVRWIEVNALRAFPAFEEFLAILFFERQRDIFTARPVEGARLTADEGIILDAFSAARWDRDVAARCLKCFLDEASAWAAARAAAKVGEALVTPGDRQTGSMQT